jgi:tripartite-type tricarboxylate transporter receptor subunit TctC
LNRSVVEALRDGDIEAQYNKLGLEASSASPGEMTASIKADRARWGAAIEEAKIPKN